MLRPHEISCFVLQRISLICLTFYSCLRCLVVRIFSCIFRDFTSADKSFLTRLVRSWRWIKEDLNVHSVYLLYMWSLPASVAQLDVPSDWRPGGRGFNPRRGRQHSFLEIDHEIFSTVILSLLLIQEGQLSASGERMCTILVNRLEDCLPSKCVVR